MSKAGRPILMIMYLCICVHVIVYRFYIVTLQYPEESIDLFHTSGTRDPFFFLFLGPNIVKIEPFSLH